MADAVAELTYRLRELVRAAQALMPVYINEFGVRQDLEKACEAAAAAASIEMPVEGPEHLSGCGSPQSLCSCPRGHLINQYRQVRVMLAYAIAERDQAIRARENCERICSDQIEHLDNEIARVTAERNNMVTRNRALRERPDLADRAPLVQQLFDDQERLWAVIEEQKVRNRRLIRQGDRRARHIRGLQQRITDLKAQLEQFAVDPDEYRHALGHVVDCTDGCPQCQHLAASVLDGGVHLVRKKETPDGQ